MRVTKFFLGLFIYTAIGEGALLLLCGLPWFAVEALTGFAALGLLALVCAYRMGRG